MSPREERREPELGEPVIRAFDAADVPALLALQHRTNPVAPRWSAAWLVDNLTDPGRDGGRRVVVVADAGGVRAAAGYVPAGADFFVAPSIVGDEAAGAALLGELVARSGAAERVRVSCFAGEDAKRASLERAGFAPLFAFHTYARAPAPVAPRATPYRRVPVDAVPLEALQAAHNRMFRGVPNATEMTLDELRFGLARMDGPASGCWVDATGAVAGFLWAQRGEDSRAAYLEIDAVAVGDETRRSGLGRAMVDRAIAAAAVAGLPEIRAIIASTNTASLALHAAAGFASAWTRDVWQRERGAA